MKNVSKLFLLAFVLAGVLPVIRADDPAPAGTPAPECNRPVRKHEKAMGERMAKKLGLSAEQKAQMKTLASEQRTAADAVRADPALSPEQKREKVEQVQQEFKAKRQALMTPEQRQKADALWDKFEKRHHP